MNHFCGPSRTVDIVILLPTVPSLCFWRENERKKNRDRGLAISKRDVPICQLCLVPTKERNVRFSILVPAELLLFSRSDWYKNSVLGACLVRAVRLSSLCAMRCEQFAYLCLAYLFVFSATSAIMMFERTGDHRF